MDILGDNAKHFAIAMQRVDGCVDHGEGRVRGTGEPEEDVGIEEDQSWASSRSR